MKKENDLKEAKNLIDKFINSLLEDSRKGVKDENISQSYMEIYTAINRLSDKGVKESEELLSYHNEIMEKYLLDFNKELNAENNNNYIDKFLILVEKINTLIYWMNRIFFI